MHREKISIAEWIEAMTDQQLGYAAYWKRVSVKLGLSEAAKLLGGDLRGAHLSAFEQGKEHPLTDEQIAAYLALLDERVAQRPVLSDEDLPDLEADTE